MCEECGDEFDTMGEMEEHMRSDHPGLLSKWLADRAAASTATAAAAAASPQHENEEKEKEEEEEEDMCEECGDEYDTYTEMLAHMQSDHPAAVAAWVAARQAAKQAKKSAAASPSPSATTRPKSLLLAGGDGEDFVFDIPVAPSTVKGGTTSDKRKSVDLGGFEIPLAAAAPSAAMSPVRKTGRLVPQNYHPTGI